MSTFNKTSSIDTSFTVSNQEQIETSTQSPREITATIVQTFNLHTMRKRSGITGANAADLCNTTYRSLRNWETGVSVPNIVNVLELLEVYGFTIDQLDMTPFYKRVHDRENIKKNEQAHLALSRLDEMRRQHTSATPTPAL